MTSTADEVPELLRPMWNERRSAILERIAVVESALTDQPAVSVAAGSAEAHKLRGLLGTFGFGKGSEIAGRAEDLLAANDPLRTRWAQVADELADLRQKLAGIQTSDTSQGEMDGTANAH